MDFEDVLGFQWETAMEVEDNRKGYGETRWIVLGYIGLRLHTLIYTWRSGVVRVISLRKANARERCAHEASQGQA